MRIAIAGQKASFKEQLRSLYKYRALFIELIRTEIKLRYRKSVLGVAWTVMNPVLNAIVLYFVFRAIFKFKSLGEVDFFPYVYTGVLVLNYLTRAVIEGSEQLHVYSGVLRRVNIPGEVFVIAKVLGNLANFIFGLLPLGIYFVFKLHPLNWNLLFLPLLLISFTLIIVSISIFLSVFYVFFRDIQHLIPIFMNIVFYISPVFYAVDMIGGSTRQIVNLNPLIGYLNGFRKSLSISGELDIKFLAMASILGLIAGYASLRFIENNRMKAVFVS